MAAYQIEYARLIARINELEQEKHALSLKVIEQQQDIYLLKREIDRLTDMGPGTTPLESVKLMALSKLAANWAEE